MPLGEDWAGQGQTFNASVVNVQEKKVSKHQMGKQVVHSSFIAKKGNMSTTFSLEVSLLDANMVDIPYKVYPSNLIILFSKPMTVI
jgi:hypothetical protein